MATPQAVLDVLAKLDGADQEAVESYINDLKDTIKAKDAELKELKGEDPDDEDMPAEDDNDEMKEDTPVIDEPEFPPLYVTGEDYDKAANAKQEAADLKASGNWEAALEKYTEAVLAAPPSALLYANRANTLLKLGRPHAAERDCDMAVKENPDSAKALRIRGKARKELGKYEEALKDLSSSQTIDYDEGTVEDLKFLAEKHVELEKAEAEKRIKEQERLRKKAEDIKKAQEEAKREAAANSSRSSASGGFPGGSMPGGMPGGMGGMPGGMPGGMGGMGGMADIMNDPEIVAAMQNPKVMAALQELMSGPGGPMGAMSNPGKIQELMSDPEVGPVLQKIMGKFAGGAAGGGGMPPGGFGGGGFGGAAGGGDGGDGDDIPDLDDLPDLEEMD